MDSTSIALYLVSNVFHIYVLSVSYRIFFGAPKFGKIIETLSFILFYAVNSAAFIFVGNAFLSLATSVVPLFLLTALYNGKMRTKFLIGAFISVAAMLFESISLGLIMLIGGVHTTENQMIGLTIADLLLLASLLMHKKSHQVAKHRTLNALHWLTIILLPVGSMVILMVLYNSGIGIPVATTIVVILILINILSFRLYDLLDEHYFSSYERALLQQQNAAYLHELDITKKTDENIKKLRHDLKNHLSTAVQLLSLKKFEALEQYLLSIDSHYISSSRFVDSGNPELDSILNVKFEEACRYEAELDVKVEVPQQLSVAPIDICVIFGNLLDNALEAIRECTDKKLKMHLFFDRGMLMVHTSNTYSGARKKEVSGDKLIYKTQKEMPEFHGLGLRTVREAIEKYNGDLIVNDTCGVFDVKIIMYLT